MIIRITTGKDGYLVYTDIDTNNFKTIAEIELHLKQIYEEKMKYEQRLQGDDISEIIIDI